MHKNDQTGKAMNRETITIHAAEHPDELYGAVTPPIYQSSTFAFVDTAQGAARFAGKEAGYIYTRLGNPTIKVLEEKIAILEEGAGAVATASGMAAITTTLLALMSSGDHMVATDAVYGATRVTIEKHFSRFGIGCDFVDTSDLNRVEEAIRPGTTKVLFIETPANPTMKITDIAGCADLARKHNMLLVVDNTFMSPYLQQPLTMGAHVVVHSMTKFINGHTDVVAGVVVASSAQILAQIRSMLHGMGGIMDPHQAWLVLRGVKTLALRMEASQNNAMKLARFLENHPAIASVSYPGLESHPQFALAARQSKGPGALMAFEVKGGIEAGKTLMENVELATLAVSLGGIETLIQHPASMTHAGMSAESRRKAGITDGMVRLSVGCEGYEDLEADFARALDKIKY